MQDLDHKDFYRIVKELRKTIIYSEVFKINLAYF